jgi:hypothetical protein
MPHLTVGQLTLNRAEWRRDRRLRPLRERCFISRQILRRRARTSRAERCRPNAGSPLVRGRLAGAKRSDVRPVVRPDENLARLA